MRSVIHAGVVLTPLTGIQNAAVVLTDGRIESCLPFSDEPAPPQVHEFPDDILAPGYIDLHLHGAAGYDVMGIDYPEFLHIGRFLASHGVTAYLPTTLTAPLDHTLRALDRISAVIEHFEKSDPIIAVPLGIHLEGPFISHARSGVHSPVHILPPSVQLFDRFWNAARGRISMLTIAPELPEALEVIAEAVKRGVVVSIGHSNADYQVGIDAFAAGARHATHCFNAMRRLEHRDPGVLGAILAERSVTADIIVDGLHVLPPVVDLFLRCKGSDGAVLISDSTSATGMPDGQYHLGSFQVTVAGLRCESHGKLAGSVLTLDVAVRNVMEFARRPLADAVRLASYNPARVLAQESQRGQIVPGAAADLVVLSPKGEVLRTFIGGREI
jgi:N-acetylglucosamine-6-phosphate deacetylase